MPMSQDILLRGSGPDILIRDGKIHKTEMPGELSPETLVIDSGDCLLSGGFVDVHVHFREPGYSYKETILSGSRCAARGGYTTVCTMPNLKPAPDSPENLALQQEIIDRDACIEVLPYACITKQRAGCELVDFQALKDRCFAFSDDGSGVQDEALMLEAMKAAADQGFVIAAHCEDNSLLRGGYIHDGEYCAAHAHKGICSESEWGQIARDLKLAEQTGCRYHVCHISTAESVQLIREAKARGVKVSCETGPHYLLLCDEDLQEEGRFKMNPPLRSAADRAALIEGIKDGTIDMIATDHAPHSADEKSRGLSHSAMGVVGLETAFAVLYTGLVREGVISLEKLLDLMCEAPRRIFGLEPALSEGSAADITVIDLNSRYTVDSSEFLSMGKASPFEGMEVYGRIKMTLKDGKTVWEDR